jgi:hypothetical protein
LLDQIVWAELEHAYGSAENVPGLLRQLASPDQEGRADAIYQLYGTIWHQGTVYQASAYAVPCLLELLQADSPADKAELLMLLWHLANGHSYLDVHQHLDIVHDSYQKEFQSAKWQAQLAQELEYVRLTREAVVAGIPIYRELLHSVEREERMLSAYLLGDLSRSHASVQHAMRERLAHEPDPQVQATLLLALGQSKALEQPSLETLHSWLARSEQPLLGWAAAMALSLQLAEQTPPAASTRLLAALNQLEQLSEAYQELAWAEDDLLERTLAACLLLGHQHAVVDALCASLGQAEPESAAQLVEAILELAFGPLPEQPSDQSGKLWRTEELSPNQRQALQAIVNSDPAWEWPEYLVRELGLYHLPPNRASLQALLGYSTDGSASA